MRYLVLPFILVSFVSCAQEHPTLDSIRIYNLPLSLHTTLSLATSDVINWKEEVSGQTLLQRETVSDSLLLSQFDATHWDSEANKTSMQHGIDVRVVLELYDASGRKEIIAMDADGYYVKGEETILRSRNRNLIRWLQNYVPDLR